MSVLYTPRLVLHPLTDAHIECEVELDADPEVLRFLYGRARSRDEVLASHAARMEEGRRAEGLGYWAAFLGDAFAGLMMLPPGPDPGSAELGYRIPRALWRQGIASEASRALIRHGFEKVGLRRIFAQTMAVNEGSQAVMRAVGMRYVRTFHPAFDDPLPGSELGEVEYEITADEWAGS
ncbi:GNAT family N-acetyltransferase [Actinoplanes sp. NPDC023714]|uniref:GNAT family N-acetyltransferase n=1 Tax=Actinoplanes sp. NPDC023714 TaxID=3154322 RepID=UPI0033DB83FA